MTGQASGRPWDLLMHDSTIVAERMTSSALRVLSFAIEAPAPRRHRTWVHRVTIALDALAEALRAQRAADDDRIGLLTEIALSEPTYGRRVEQLQGELLDLAVAVASLREQIEPDPTLEPVPDEVREQLCDLTQRFRHHQDRRAALILEATGLDIDGIDPSKGRAS